MTAMTPSTKNQTDPTSRRVAQGYPAVTDMGMEPNRRPCRDGGECLRPLSTMNRIPILVLAAIAITVLGSCTGDPVAIHGPAACPDATEIANSLDLVMKDSDVSLLNEGDPHGVPESYDWYSHPTRYEMTTMPVETVDEFHAIVGWGEIYEEAGGSKSTNTRVQVRNLQTWYRLKQSVLSPGVTQQWILANPGVVDEPDAAWFDEDFSTNINRPSDHYPLDQSLGGGITGLPGNGYVFHFFPRDRHQVDLIDVEAVFTTVQIRLVTADASLPTDCDQARFIANVGTDVYISQGDEPIIAPAIATGRFRRVTKDWQWFNVINAPDGNDSAYVLSDPPPLNKQ